MVFAEMKTLTIGDTTYKVVDEQARSCVEELSEPSLLTSANIAEMKTLTINDTTYEVVDNKARSFYEDLSELCLLFGAKSLYESTSKALAKMKTLTINDTIYEVVDEQVRSEIEELNVSKLLFGADVAKRLYTGAAIDWLNKHTTLVIDKQNFVKSVAALPDGAKLFILRYCEVMVKDGNVTSESIGGMSQSFGTASKAQQLWQLAFDLISGYLKSQVQSVSNVSKWV